MIASLTFAFVLLLPAGLTAPTQDCTLDRLTATPADHEAVAAFRAAADDYAALHRRLDRALMVVHYSSWSDEGDMERETLGEVIRAARPQSRRGTIFNGAVTELIRFRLGRAVWLQRYRDAETLAEAAAQPLEPPRVHDGWFGDDQARWEPLVSELPALPEELEYRFTGRHLVLIDAHAQLVVDVLADALPAR